MVDPIIIFGLGMLCGLVIAAGIISFIAMQNDKEHLLNKESKKNWRL